MKPWERYASPPVPGGPWERYAQGESLPVPRELSGMERGAMRVKGVMDAATELPYVGGTARALRDRAQAVTQIVARPFASRETMNEYEGLRQSSEQGYQEARRQQGDEGFDWDRTIGGAAIDAVITSRLPGVRGGPAPTMIGRMKQGAIIGGAAGAMTPVASEKQGGEFYLTKALQTAGGGLIGGVAPLVVEPVIAGITAGANRVASRIAALPKTIAGQTSDKAIEFNLSMTLKTQGVDWGKLSTDVQKSMVTDVRAAIKAGKPITPEQIARYADFKAIGAPATRGQITLDPMLVKQEQNLKGVMGVGEDLTQRFDLQNRAVFDRLAQAQAGTGSANANPLDAGRAITERLAGVNAAEQAKVRAAYTAAKNAAGTDAEVPLQRLAQTFGEMRGTLDMDLLPGPVRARLTSYGLMEGKQTKLFTVADAEDLLKTINANYDPMKPAAARALDELRRAVKGSIDDMADAGGPAAGLFSTARQTASTRFKQLETTPALQAAKDGKLMPDDVIEKYVVSKGAKVDQLSNLLEAGGDTLKADVKAAVLQRLAVIAQGNSPDAARQFQFASFNNELKRIGQDKLKLIFNADELSEINRLARIGSVMNFNPKSVTINRSGTSQAVIDLMSRAQGVPFANRLLAAPTMSAIQQNQAYNAANAGLAGVPGGLLSDALRAQLAERSGLLGAAAIAPLPGLLLGPQ